MSEVMWKILNWFGILNKYQRREQKVIKTCGCICYCPSCKDILNDQADCTDTDYVRYKCNTCGHNSVFSFDIGPCPILMKEVSCTE